MLKKSLTTILTILLLMTFVGNVHAAPGDCNIDRKYIFKDPTNRYIQTVVQYIPHEKLQENLKRIKKDKEWFPYLAGIDLGFIPGFTGKVIGGAFGIFMKLSYDTAINLAERQLKLSKDTGKCGIMFKVKSNHNDITGLSESSQGAAPPLCLYTHTCKN